MFHFVFTLFKIAVLASAYATMLVVLVAVGGAFRPHGVVARVSARPQRLWKRTRLVVALLLFVFSFTHWGNHGLGDMARIPLNHYGSMVEINGLAAYFEADRSAIERNVTAYQVVRDTLCAQSDDDTHFIYDLESGHYQLFSSRPAYNAYARQHGLPRSQQLAPFRDHYSRYWSGWRFWLLA